MAQRHGPAESFPMSGTVERLSECGLSGGSDARKWQHSQACQLGLARLLGWERRNGKLQHLASECAQLLEGQCARSIQRTFPNLLYLEVIKAD
jgi:hypothetical protein